MTTHHGPPAAPDVVRAVLSDDSVRRRIAAIVRRRVPPQEVEDVVHAVLCDALVSEQAPAEPKEIPPWLFGIARHKVVDHHRAAGRRGRATADAAELAGRTPPLEARSLLRTVLADAVRDERGAETMRWIAREAEGERLDEMAREASLPAATVRQRVSRLRRWLRKRWLHEAVALAAAVGVVGLLLLGGPRRHGVTPIVGDPMGDSAATASASLQGRWRVASVQPDAALDPARRALVDADAMTTVVDVDGSHLRFTSATHHAERRLEVGAFEQGRFEVRIVDAAGRVQRASATLDGAGRLVLVGTEGDWRGVVTLTR